MSMRIFTARAGALALLAGLCLPADAIVVETYGPFDVSFYEEGDVYGTTTNQQDWTAEQMADVESAIQAWDAGIQNTAGRQISLHLLWDDLPSGVLGSSGSSQVYGGGQRWQSGEFIWREEDDPANYGIEIDVDSLIRYDVDAAGVGWNFGEDGPGPGQIDFRSVITHELGHSVGVTSSYLSEEDFFGYVGRDAMGDPVYEGLTAWDVNLVDSAGNRPAVGTNGVPDNFDELGNPVYWDGDTATNLYGGLVPIYAPETYSSGSSLSHLDEGTFPGALMSPQIGAGQLVREPTDLEWAMMTDMGWQVIPEPAAVLLSTFGLGLMRLLRRRFVKRLVGREDGAIPAPPAWSLEEDTRGSASIWISMERGFIAMRDRARRAAPEAGCFGKMTALFRAIEDAAWSKADAWTQARRARDEARGAERLERHAARERKFWDFVFRLESRLRNRRRRG
ncbi:hypothetical protein [Kiritimatiella glycovorans]|uniref:PEP-CTERM protein-sorting domain-containing protein n=1 Tax=Kiritimatiella glycovorans TaxID=1307763 RepID=A0A0G3EIT6_9BACT|nr:hypothetical protein [Kiritimatiella glycovorans]AKJ64745.1 hypothetical protein L21SP4_01500 [Kiritimatiella glycovorans]